jgi:UDP-glucose 6-dehydrogenase
MAVHRVRTTIPQELLLMLTKNFHSLEECLDVKSKHISEINEQESPIIDRSTEEILTKQISADRDAAIGFPTNIDLGAIEEHCSIVLSETNNS